MTPHMSYYGIHNGEPKPVCIVVLCSIQEKYRVVGIEPIGRQLTYYLFFILSLLFGVMIGSLTFTLCFYFEWPFPLFPVLISVNHVHLLAHSIFV